MYVCIDVVVHGTSYVMPGHILKFAAAPIQDCTDIVQTAVGVCRGFAVLSLFWEPLVLIWSDYFASCHASVLVCALATGRRMAFLCNSHQVDFEVTRKRA